MTLNPRASANSSDAAIAEPANIAALPHDDKGRPVPRFVAWIGGKPDHRIASTKARRELTAAGVCHICGKPLDYRIAFLTGPMGLANRYTSEGPLHRECAEYTLRACPHLAGGDQTKRRTIGVPDDAVSPTGMVIHRPEKIALVIVRGYEIEGDGFRFRKPIEVVWWKQGEPI